MKLSTLCYLEKNGCYLMLHRTKKQEDVNKNKWIGVGGKLEPGEAPEECLFREVLEETGLSLGSCRFRGMLSFIYDEQEPEYIFTYTSDDFTGEMTDCDEGELQWIPKDSIQGLELWEGDRYMLHMLLDDRTEIFSLKLCYDKDDRLTEACSLLPVFKRLK